VDRDHRYTRGDRAALILFGAGRCYWPDCTAPLLGVVEGRYKIALEIAHIRAARPGGERYVADMTAERRKSFDNLIFLCALHHKTVDERGAAERYPISTLEKWKTDREKGGLERLRGLRDVTEDKLVELISTAMQQRDQDIRDTLARLERTDAEAAELVRELRDELRMTRKRGSILDPDVVTMLSGAASKLVGLGDQATLLIRAAEGLAGLEDHVGMLSDAASRLAGMEDRVAMLRRAADDINKAALRMEDFR
jgi:hypothetical protein